MPIDDHFKRRIAHYHILEKIVCRRCSTLNPLKAKKYNRCHSKDLRLKRKELTKYDN